MADNLLLAIPPHLSQDEQLHRFYATLPQLKAVFRAKGFTLSFEEYLHSPPDISQPEENTRDVAIYELPLPNSRTYEHCLDFDDTFFKENSKAFCVKINSQLLLHFGYLTPEGTEMIRTFDLPLKQACGSYSVSERRGPICLLTFPFNPMNNVMGSVLNKTQLSKCLEFNVAVALGVTQLPKLLICAFQEHHPTFTRE